MRRVLVQFEEYGVVDGVRVSGSFEEAARRPQLLDDEGVARGQQLGVGGG